MIHRLRNDHDTRQKLIDKRLNLSRYLRLSLLGIVIAICVLYWYACATKSNEDMEKNTGVTKMRATTQFPEATKRERIAVNTKELQAMLGCGRKTVSGFVPEDPWNRNEGPHRLSEYPTGGV